MKLATKAALLSGLICPGSGLFLLKKYWLGLAFIIPALGAFIYILVFATQVATNLAEQIRSGQLPLNPAVLSAEINSALTGEGTGLYSLAKILFLISWLVSIAVSYWLARRFDDNNHPSPASSQQ